MAISKAFVFLALLSLMLLISSHASARSLAESTTNMSNTKGGGAEEAKELTWDYELHKCEKKGKKHHKCGKKGDDHDDSHFDGVVREAYQQGVLNYKSDLAGQHDEEEKKYSETNYEFGANSYDSYGKDGAYSGGYDDGHGKGSDGGRRRCRCDDDGYGPFHKKSGKDCHKDGGDEGDEDGFDGYEHGGYAGRHYPPKDGNKINY